MPYIYKDDISIADAAIEVYSDSLEGIFIDSGKALTNTMVDNLESINIKKKIEFKVESEEIDMLLFEFLEQLVIEKDANQLIFSEFNINIKELDEKYELYAIAKGEHIDYKKHELCADVKAVTLHRFSLTKEDSGWKATMILDI